MKTERLYRTFHPPYLKSQPLYLCHHTDGTHLCIDISHYWWHHNKCASYHTWNTYDIIPNLHPITFTLYDMNDHVLWQHINGIRDIRSSLYDIISTLYDITPLYVWYQVHCICPHVHCICVITPNLSMTSQPLQERYYMQYICDIISPMVLTKYPLSMTSQHSVLMSLHSHLAYIWHPLQCRWYRTHSITPNNGIYDVISTSRITSHPCIRYCTYCIFVITTSLLISQPLLNDITPTFCVTLYALYRTSHPIVISPLYCTYDITTSNYETTSSM